MAKVLSLQGIGKSYPGVVALREASLEAHGGEVHALMGANGAGKSTLMNVLGGVIEADVGTITIDGAPIRIRRPLDAIEHGIAFVQQELNMLPTMTVAENICIGHLPGKSWSIESAAMKALSQPLLDRLGCHFSPDEQVEVLGTGDRQMVEIARALLSSPQILIFDEPTSSLSQRERRRLFDTIRNLKASGTVIIYITHFVDEIFEISDRVTVMRDGTTVGSGPIANFSPADIVQLMIGQPKSELTQSRNREIGPVNVGEVLLEVRDLNRAGALHDIDLEVRAGEVVGIWGLLGSGRTELLRALTGLDPIDGGSIRLRKANGGLLEQVSPRELHRHVGFVTEDRRGEGLLLPLSVEHNISLPSLKRLLRFGLAIDRHREAELARDAIKKLTIRLASVRQPTATLSGGNQQKVVIARWLATSPRLFFLDEPTRGVDVGAKTEILRLAREIAATGVGVVLVSSEIDEIQRVSDRYLVMKRGRIVAELPVTATKDQLMGALATGVQRGTMEVAANA